MKVIHIMLLSAVLLAATSCTPDDTDQTNQSSQSAAQDQTNQTAQQQAAPQTESKQPAPQTPQPAGQNPVVTMKTTEGTIKIELFKDKAPVTVDNFLSYVKDGFYDGTIFHRVIGGFMIQGGGLTPDLQKKPTKAPIKNESTNHLRNSRGTIAMARTNAPDSASSQFFINLVDNRSLDFDGPYAPGYAVFGKVIAGMDVVDRIAAIPTRTVGQRANVPTKPVIIESVTVDK